MIKSDINLLPEQAIEHLHQDKHSKEKLYFILAIGISLIVVTIVFGVTTILYWKSVRDALSLLSDQEQKLEELNPLWNETIKLQGSKELIRPIRDDNQRLFEAWEAVTFNLQSLRLVGFNRVETQMYKIDVEGVTAEESSLYLSLLKDSLQEAQVSLQSIQQKEDVVIFTIIIDFIS